MIGKRGRAVLLTLGGLAIWVALSACAAAAAAPVDPPPPTTAEVEATQHTLDSRAASVPATVTSWGVDPAAKVVVVTVSGPRTPEVDRFLAGVDPRTLRVDTMAPPVQTFPTTSG